MSKHKRPIDENILKAINDLKWPLVNKDGNKVFLRKRARNESGAEHVAGKLHLLKVRDIRIVPEILKNPINVIRDKRKGKLYFGKRKGLEKIPYLKIVVKEEKDGTETIVTICTSKTIVK